MVKVEERIAKVALAIASLGYEGIVRFDLTEPEYTAFSSMYQKVKTPRYLALLGICAAVIDYQLAGNAQQFWKCLEQIVLEYGNFESIQELRAILKVFLDESVNGRFNTVKRKRVGKLLDQGFAEWFIDNYGDVPPLIIWKRVAKTLDNRMEMKTVVFAMKVLDIINLIVNNDYLSFPPEIPIPCNLHVGRVARYSGIVNEEASTTQVRSAWTAVAQQVSSKLERKVSLLRIDSIVWQIGQIMSREKGGKDRCIQTLVAHIEDLDIDLDSASILADEMTFLLFNTNELR